MGLHGLQLEGRARARDDLGIDIKMPNRKGKALARQQLDGDPQFLTFPAGRGATYFPDPEHLIDLVIGALGVDLDLLGAMHLFVIVILQKAPAGKLDAYKDAPYHQLLFLAIPQLFLLPLH